MREGWRGNEYLVLLSDQESLAASQRYGIQEYLPGYKIVGLRGWDDLIVRDAKGSVYTVPSVPMDSQYLASWTMPDDAAPLESDLRITGKIKWYTKPLIFGGDASDPSNTLWISQAKHVELVTWWNLKYRELRAASGDA